MAPKTFPRKGAWCTVTSKEGETALGIIAEFPYVETKMEDRPNPDFDPSRELTPENDKTVRTRVEIVHEDQAEVHLVDENGETAQVLRGVTVNALTQPKIADLPERRRPDPTLLDPSLGYHDADDLELHAAAQAARVRAEAGEEGEADSTEK